MDAMKRITFRGTERHHMEQYLLHRGYTRMDDNIFSSAAVTVSLSRQDTIRIGSLSLCEVDVIFQGDPVVVDAESAQFRSRFMTAGG